VPSSMSNSSPTSRGESARRPSSRVTPTVNHRLTRRESGKGFIEESSCWVGTTDSDADFVRWLEFLTPDILRMFLCCVPKQDAEDLLQKVSIELWHKRDQNQNRAYCLTKAKLRVKDYFRKCARTHETSESELGGGEETVSLESIVSIEAADESMDAKLTQLREGLAWLQSTYPTYEQALRLTEFKDLSDEEVAELLDFPIQLLRTRKHRAKQKLAAWLREHKGWNVGERGI
jgi:RNA polymerase sigma factor (sigma-70 family)